MSEFQINRRNVMLFATGSALAPVIRSAPVRAQTADQVGNAAVYQFSVGDIKATVVSDGLLSGPPKIYAHDAPEAELQEVLRRAFLPTDKMTLNMNTLLVEIGGRRILIEAGAAQTMGPNGGRLLANLAAIGVRPEDIDIVVASHTHPDHLGNLRNSEGGKTFPRAVVYVPEADWDFFVRNDPDLSYIPAGTDFQRRFANAIKQSVEPVRDVVELYQAGAEIVPGLTTLAAEGHTPGMVAFLLQSGGQQVLLTADLAYHPVVNINHPWQPGPDRDKDTALASRRRIFDMAAADRLLVLGFHYPFPGLGRLLKTDGGWYAWVPENWQF
jgi:glyoxylase-like metal-dependent hydrolase (beta-lactamase superfamily II)